MLGIYIHIPFCRVRCRYCDFVSGVYDESTAKLYVEMLKREILSRPIHPALVSEDKLFKVDTVFFGGGTPSTLYSGAIKDILEAIKRRFLVLENAEISIECNPESLSSKKVEEYIDAGINRVSLGIQSLDEGELEWAGRAHTSEQALDAIATLRRLGIKNISCDLMLGLKGQSERTLDNTLSKIIASGVSHISAYALKVEPRTSIFKEGFKVDEDLCASLYDFTVAKLYKAGFMRYEISNFALEGYKCRHNLKYWRYEPYIGFGVGAVGTTFYGGGQLYCEGNTLYAHACNQQKNKNREEVFALRQTNCSNVLDYIKDLPQVFEPLCRNECIAEYIMLSLRLSEGVDLMELKERYSYDLLKEKALDVDILNKNGIITYNNKRLRLLDEYFYLHSAVATKLM